MNNSSHVGPSKSELLRNFLQIIEPIDLVQVLLNEVEDDLLKYQFTDEAGIIKIDALKIPRSLYIVAICVHLNYLIALYGWGIAQKNGSLYIYNGFFWLKVSTDEFKRFLGSSAKFMGYYSPADAVTPQFANAAYKQFLLSADIPEQKLDKSKVLINLQNGTFDVISKELREHRAEDFLTYCLTYNYDPMAEAPLYQAYLDRVLPDHNSQHILLEFHGYFFVPLKLEKALFLLGGGSNGKSVQFEVTTALLGKDNVSTKTIGDLMSSDMGNDALGKLENKLVNYGSEIDAKQINVDLLKRLISGEPVSYREKYKGSFDLVNTCKFIFNANGLPKTTEQTIAFFRRFLIIPYVVTITENEKDVDLHTKIITQELPGILNLVILGAERLLENKRFTYSEAGQAAITQYKHESNVVSLFREDYRLESSNQGKISNSTLYQAFKQFCRDNGERSLSKKQFSHDLKNLGFTTYRTSKERGFKVKMIQKTLYAKQLPSSQESTVPDQRSWIQKLLKK